MTVSSSVSEKIFCHRINGPTTWLVASKPQPCGKSLMVALDYPPYRDLASNSLQVIRGRLTGRGSSWGHLQPHGKDGFKARRLLAAITCL